MTRAAFFASTCLLVISAACSAQRAGNATPQQQSNAMPNQLTPQEERDGWRLLFDGKTTNGWRGYRMTTMPAGWEVVDGALTRVGRSRDIVTTEQYKDFDLQLEWKTNAGGNSGIFYRAVETDGPIYHSAPEYQLLDDNGHADGRNELTSAGSNYALNPVPRGVVKPVGEWNTTRIVVRGNHVEHWLNGQKVVEYEFGSADWKEGVAKSKFNEWKDYGQSPTGFIGLQGDHGWVAFRNIKIKTLK
jgi:hypothetical protein